MKKLSVAIVTWNSKDYFERCLDSIKGKLVNLEFEIIVVDNGSQDGTDKLLNRKYPDLRLLKNEKNMGVAKGRNQALKVAKGEYILILDVDTEILSSGLDRFLNFLDNDEEIGIAGCKLISPDGDLQLSCRTLPKPIHVIFRRLSFLPRIKNTSIIREYTMSDWDHNEVREVDFLLGAFQIIRRKAMERVGLLDERMFYGFEDADYCARMRKSGYKLIYYPHFETMHYQRRITASSFPGSLAFQNFKSYLIFYAKHRGYIKELETRR